MNSKSPSPAQIIKRQLALLDETVKYYAADTDRRSTKEGDITCFYQNKDGCRCAIGRLLSDSNIKHLKKEDKLDESFDDILSSFKLWAETNPKLKVCLYQDDYLTYFGSELQSIHDHPDNWNLKKKCRMTKEGRQNVTSLRRKIKRGEFTNPAAN